jgi:hypothetical protein
MKSFGKSLPVLAIALILTACGGGQTELTTNTTGGTDAPTTANRPPVISGTPSVTVNEGSSYQFTPVATDADGDTLTYSVENLPAWASFNAHSGSINGTPATGDAGIYGNIVVSVSDGVATTSLAPFSISVASVSTGGGSAPVGGQFSFSASTSSVTEGNVVSVSVVRTNSVGAASVMYGTHGVTAVSSTMGGDDYQGFDPIPVNFADGETSKVVTVQTLDNTVQESTEIFEIYLTTPSTGYTRGTNSVATVSIIDNDTAQNQPPTISGTPATSVISGATYSFTPSASDPDGDTLTFSASNLPAWLTINSSTGALSGTPADTDVGVVNNIQISVSDGTETASLAAFSITVDAAQTLAKGSLDLNWAAPTTRADGSALSLSEINGYVVYIGTSSDNMQMLVDLNDNSATSYTINDLTVGTTYYIALSTYDVAGASSSLSNVVSKTVTN